MKKIQDRYSPVAQIIKNELERLQAADTSFSLRAFAKRLGISPASVSEMIRGKRAVTRKTAQMLIDRFKLEPQLVYQIQRILVSDFSGNDPQAEIETIRKLISDFQVGWNQHAARKMASLWAPNGCLIEPWGLVFDGREAIERFYRAAHTTYLKDARIEMRLKQVAFAQKNSAFVDLDAVITGIQRENDPAPLDMHFNIPLSVVKLRGRWWIVASRPHVVLPPASQPWGDNPPPGQGK